VLRIVFVFVLLTTCHFSWVNPFNPCQSRAFVDVSVLVDLLVLVHVLVDVVGFFTSLQDAQGTALCY